MKSDQRSCILSTDQGWRGAIWRLPAELTSGPWCIWQGAGPWEVVSQSLSFHHQRFVFPDSGLKPCHLVWLPALSHSPVSSCLLISYFSCLALALPSTYCLPTFWDPGWLPCLSPLSPSREDICPWYSWFQPTLISPSQALFLHTVIHYLFGSLCLVLQLDRRVGTVTFFDCFLIILWDNWNTAFGHP